nr:glutathione S-transferase T3-like [Tanacetum cinerariifolium]
MDLFDEDEDEEEHTRQCARWIRGEEILLTECWIETSENGQIEVDRTDDSFWGQIMDDFKNRTTQGYHTKHMLTGKWSKINGDCQKFNAIYKHIKRKSKENEADHIKAAKITFAAQQPKGRKFQLEHAWRILKGHSKWDSLQPLYTKDHTEIFGNDTRPQGGSYPDYWTTTRVNHLMRPLPDDIVQSLLTKEYNSLNYVISKTSLFESGSAMSRYRFISGSNINRPELAFDSCLILPAILMVLSCSVPDPWEFHGSGIWWIRRIQILDTAYRGFLGVGTTFDIFQNILFPYSLNTTYCLFLDTAYRILFPSWSLVSAGTDTPYLP